MGVVGHESRGILEWRKSCRIMWKIQRNATTSAESCRRGEEVCQRDHREKKVSKRKRVRKEDIRGVTERSTSWNRSFPHQCSFSVSSVSSVAKFFPLVTYVSTTDPRFPRG